MFNGLFLPFTVNTCVAFVVESTPNTFSEHQIQMWKDKTLIELTDKRQNIKSYVEDDPRKVLCECDGWHQNSARPHDFRFQEDWTRERWLNMYRFHFQITKKCVTGHFRQKNDRWNLILKYFGVFYLEPFGFLQFGSIWNSVPNRSK